MIDVPLTIAAPYISRPGRRFKVGDHVQCLHATDGWIEGHVIKLDVQDPQVNRDRQWPLDHVAAYQVKFMDGRTVYVPDDSPKIIRSFVCAPEGIPARRFEVGDFVECYCGNDVWEAGTVLLLDIYDPHHNRQNKWPVDLVCPYKVRLGSDGREVCAPDDNDDCIRKANKEADSDAETIDADKISKFSKDELYEWVKANPETAKTIIPDLDTTDDIKLQDVLSEWRQERDSDKPTNSLEEDGPALPGVSVQPGEVPDDGPAAPPEEPAASGCEASGAPDSDPGESPEEAIHVAQPVIRPLGPNEEVLLLPAGVLVLVEGDRWVSGRIVIDSLNGTLAAIEVCDDSPDVESATGFLIPGLIDTHVHVTATTADLAGLRRLPASYVACAALAELRASVERGFTTVRDTGGADCGMAQAAAEGLAGVCSRLLFVGRALSQTGGHGDFRTFGQKAQFGDGGGDCGCVAAGIGRVVDGVAQCRHACRDELRQGAHAIKIMAGGGVSSPTDRLEDLQFSDEEISAIVDEATRKHTYVLAHAYTPEAITRCVELGVRSIEHGNQLNEAAAAAMAKHDAFLSQTNITYLALRESGAAAGMPAAQLAKVGALVEQGIAAVGLARSHGVRVTYGSDCLGPMRTRQLEGFGLLLDAGMTPAEALQTATSTAAELLNIRAGAIKEGLLADLLLLSCNPLKAQSLRALSKADVLGVWVGGKAAVSP